MKTVSAPLLAYLNSFRTMADAPLCFAELYTITLTSGAILTYTSLDVPVAWNGYAYSANSIQISGLKYKALIGCSPDTQDIVISAAPTDLIGGIPFLQALQQGLFDGAFIQRERAFFATFAGVLAPLVPLGAIILFKGRVSEIQEIGRTTAKVAVVSDLVLLDIDMPRNIFQPNCSHVLYDSGCGLNRASYTTSGACGAGSSINQIYWSGAASAQQQGAVTFTSGQNVGAEATVKTAVGGTALVLAYPLNAAPAIGDTFTVCQGCDHTAATCQSQFGNLQNFRGFPYVPPPQIMTGPMSSTQTSGK